MENSVLLTTTSNRKKYISYNGYYNKHEGSNNGMNVEAMELEINVLIQRLADCKDKSSDEYKNMAERLAELVKLYTEATRATNEQSRAEWNYYLESERIKEARRRATFELVAKLTVCGIGLVLGIATINAEGTRAVTSSCKQLVTKFIHV